MARSVTSPAGGLRGSPGQAWPAAWYRSVGAVPLAVAAQPGPDVGQKALQRRQARGLRIDSSATKVCIGSCGSPPCARSHPGASTSPRWRSPRAGRSRPPTPLTSSTGRSGARWRSWPGKTPTACRPPARWDHGLSRNRLHRWIELSTALGPNLADSGLNERFPLGQTGMLLSLVVSVLLTLIVNAAIR